ncbi:MAG: phosphoenolpyruvate synthase [Candidatus Pacearchaeota archaeon]
MIAKKEVDFRDKYIKWFSELSNKNVDIAGGKGASLGEMFNNKFPVPPGFVVTAQSFAYFLEHHGLADKINNIILGIDMEDTAELDEKAKEIRELILKTDMPSDLKTEIIEAYNILGTEKIEGKGVSSDALTILRNAQEPIFVSVRSSATTEDSADASFAGQQDSFLNIKGGHQVVEHVKKCFASLYTARSIYYRKQKGIQEGQSLLAVVVQKMIDSEKSGIIFSRNPMTMEDDIVIEAVYGLGTGIVSGLIKPDNYVVSRDLKIKSMTIVDKLVAIVRTGSGSNEKVKLSAERSKSQVLSHSQILEAANQAIKLEEHYGKPQDIEFAVEEEKIYIVQSRPITTLKTNVKKTGELSGNILLNGLGASPGIGVGIVKIIKGMEDLSKIKKGDVLVTEMTDPDMVVSMQKSTAIVTDEGGMTSHAAIVSREMGIPAIVGTGNATSVLKDGMKVTVDGTHGKVYEGQVAETSVIEIEPIVETHKIKLKLIVDLPEFAERAAKSGIDSVGLLRLEGIIASSNKHPLLYEKENTLEDYTELLRNGIEKISRPFKSVWIRSSDVRTDEFSGLKGSPEREINPMLGLHGIRFSLKHPKIFEAELNAIKKVAEEHPNKNFGVMFPQVISIEEVLESKKIFNAIASENMDFGVMVETPAAVQVIEDLAKEVSFISFGTNDLTQFTLAVDRGDDNVQHLYNEMHPAVIAQIEKVIKACRGKVQTSICGQAGSNPEMVEKLFRFGIDSISVNADAAKSISELIKSMEDKGIKHGAEGSLAKANEKTQKMEVEMEKKKWGFDITCDECGKIDNVPFKPKKGWPVYCKECYKNKRSKKNNPELPTLPVESPNIKQYEEDNKKIQKQLLNENIGAIEPINNHKRINDIANNIIQEVEQKNKKEAEKDKEKDDDILMEPGDDFNLRDSLGVYNPDEETGKSQYDYSFEDGEDEYSDVF